MRIEHMLLEEQVKYYRRQSDHFHDQLRQARQMAGEKIARIAELEKQIEQLRVDANCARNRCLVLQSEKVSLSKLQEALERDKESLARAIEGLSEKIDLLRTIRDRQAEIIRRQRAEAEHRVSASEVEQLRGDLAVTRAAWKEACEERDTASRRSEGWRKRAVLWRNSFMETRTELTKWKNEALEHRKRNAFKRHSYEYDGPPVLVKPACNCNPANLCEKCRPKTEVYANPVEAMKANPRLAMMIEEDIRRGNYRNIDTQKATDNVCQCC